jgi:proline dehydrogenase
MEHSPLAKPLTRRFIAGLTLDDGLRVCGELARTGITSSLDYLGENVATVEEARQARNAYLEALRRIRDGGLPTTVSMKITSLGLDISEQECSENTNALVQLAREIGTRIEMDMEASEYVDRNLALVKAMHARHQSVRAVIQAYLYRSEADIRELNELRVPIRLCKGAYKEPPSIAYPKKADVDANYLKLMKLLLDRGTYPAIATHDDRIVDECLNYIQQNRYTPDRFEFQMLYGVRRDLQNKVVSKGYRLRLYVPYGAAWYPYFMRRLAERPANVMFILRTLFRG